MSQSCLFVISFYVSDTVLIYFLHVCIQKGEAAAISELFPFTKFFDNAPQVSFVLFVI